MKIITYNVNGIRSALSKGWLDWIKSENPDVLCVQEIKAQPDQLDLELFTSLGFETFWYPAIKKGYSGVAIFSKIKPKHVEYGCGNQEFDNEGRTIRLDFEEVSVLNIYAPSGTTGEIRQDFKYKWMDYFFDYTQKLKSELPNIIICGDFNICHKPIDIHNPISNAKSSGFLPEERAWMEKLLTEGEFIDTYRHFNQAPHQYTWWSYRAGSRSKNLGWRIDYIIASQPVKSKLKSVQIHQEAVHSDHCAVELVL